MWFVSKRRQLTTACDEVDVASESINDSSMGVKLPPPPPPTSPSPLPPPPLKEELPSPSAPKKCSDSGGARMSTWYHVRSSAA